jgi:hypothetical protein
MQLIRPAWWQTVIVASCAGGTVVAYAQGLWDQQWAGWLALFLAMELGAAASHEKGDTLSERVWAWLGIRPRRPLRLWRAASVVLFLAELAAHFATGGEQWWSGGGAVIVTALPLGAAIVSGFLKWRVTRWKL